MKKIVICLILIMLMSRQTFACLNEIGESSGVISGVLKDTDPNYFIPEARKFDDTLELKRSLNFLYRDWKKTKNINTYSDYGVYLVYLGEYQKAKLVYEDIERQMPGRYVTAANLGTIYELMGNNQEALHWMERAVRINSTSHKGSEWLHLNILRVKVKADKDKNFLTQDLTSKELIGTNFGEGALPQTELDSLDVVKIRNDISYQLRERVSFIKPKEQIVARLLFDLGNSSFLLGDYISASQVYLMAKSYGFTDAILDARLETLYTMAPEHQPNIDEPAVLVDKATTTPFTAYSWWLVGGICAVIIIGIIAKKTWRK